MERHKSTCTQADCFNLVKESDVERDSMGNIYERSKKCWDCRTGADRRAIKRWRKNKRV